MNMNNLVNAGKNPVKALLVLLIKGYRYCISPLMAGHCRFHPTCSRYSQQAIEQFGVLRGSYLTIRRLLRCHPWHSGGIDPLPERFSLTNKKNLK